MTSRDVGHRSVSEICAKVKHLGYAVSQRIRLYGEDFDVVSDPFAEGEGIAIQVKREADSRIRVLRLPTTVLQSLRGGFTRAARAISAAANPKDTVDNSDPGSPA